MTKVGLRELKNSLSEYVARVRNGASVLVTDRGKPVAELRPVSKGNGRFMRTSMEDLARTGVLTRGKPNQRKLYPSLPRVGKRSAAELLNEERGSR